MKTKTKRRICIAVGALALLLMLVFFGGTEMGWMPLGRGAALAVCCEAVSAVCWWKAGWIRL